MQSLRYRAIGALVVLVLGLAYMLPSLPGVKASGLGKILPGDAVSLGLDLKGGMHLVLEVKTDKVIRAEVQQYGERIKRLR